MIKDGNAKVPSHLILDKCSIGIWKHKHEEDKNEDSHTFIWDYFPYIFSIMKD